MSFSGFLNMELGVVLWKTPQVNIILNIILNQSCDHVLKT